MLYVNPMAANPTWRNDPAQIKTQRESQALEEFERVFLYQMLREMRSTVPVEGIFEKSPAQTFFEESMDDALAGQMAQSRQLGIAAQIKSQWTQLEDARATRDNGLLQDAVRSQKLHPDLNGLPMSKEGPELRAFTPPSSLAAELPIKTHTPLSLTGTAGR